MTVVLANNVASTLAADLTATAGSLTLATGSGARFPNTLAGRYYYATIIAPSGVLEIVQVTSRVGDLLTITRGAEGTTPVGFTSGSRVELRITAQSVLDAVADGVATVGIAVGTTPPENPAVNTLWVDTN
jgi:hypothetical protein